MFVAGFADCHLEFIAPFVSFPRAMVFRPVGLQHEVGVAMGAGGILSSSGVSLPWRGRVACGCLQGAFAGCEFQGPELGQVATELLGCSKLVPCLLETIVDMCDCFVGLGTRAGDIKRVKCAWWVSFRRH